MQFLEYTSAVKCVFAVAVASAGATPVGVGGVVLKSPPSKDDDEAASVEVLGGSDVTVHIVD